MMLRHLFTSNSSGYIKKGILVSLLGVCFICGVKVLDYVYWQVNELSRVTWKSFYSQDSINTVFIGSSHVYSDIDVNIVDQRLGVDSFDIASSAQRIQQSYWNLLEADRIYDIHSAFIELYYQLSTGNEGNYSSKGAMNTVWTDTDYMRTSYVRLAEISMANDTEHLFEATMPFIRFRKYLFDWDYISKQHDIKTSEKFRNYLYQVDFEGNGCEKSDISSKGFRPSTRVMDSDDLDLLQNRTSEEMKLTDDAKEYLIKCIKYCEDKNINLTFFISPMYELQTISTEGYDNYYYSVKEIADEYKIPLYDFNLVKEEYLQLEQTDYHDVGHLNTKGADKFTTCLLDVLQSANKEYYFYESFEEKIKNTNPKVYGYYWKIDEKSNNRIMTLAASDCPEMEYRVILTKDNTEDAGSEKPEQRIIQDFGSNKQFSVPEDEHGMLTIEWRMAGEEDQVENIECEY